ncbi:MAG: hypothetical protein ACE5HS_16195 [bacterium]
MESLDNYKIAPISPGLEQENYFGRYYVGEKYEAVLARALANDTESKVLRLVIENAREKKRLAERGRWDIFVNARGRYNYLGLNEDEISPNGYVLNLGLKINKFDSEVL